MEISPQRLLQRVNSIRKGSSSSTSEEKRVAKVQRRRSLPSLSRGKPNYSTMPLPRRSKTTKSDTVLPKDDSVVVLQTKPSKTRKFSANLATLERSASIRKAKVTSENSS